MSVFHFVNFHSFLYYFLPSFCGFNMLFLPDGNGYLDHWFSVFLLLSYMHKTIQFFQ